MQTVRVRAMEVVETVICPYCGEAMEWVLDTSIASQSWIADCQVCCRPFELAAECEPGHVVSLVVKGG